jgi:hypothetical protein
MKAKTLDTIDELKEISNRGRVAFAICCLESAADSLHLNKEHWKLVFDELWKFCSSDMAVWKERFGELLPDAVSEKVDFTVKNYQYFTKEEHDALQQLYGVADAAFLQIIHFIYIIGITNINVTIRNEALKLATIPELQKLISLVNSMNLNQFRLPDIKLFKKFPITDNRGWGWTFTRDEVFKKES